MSAASRDPAPTKSSDLDAKGVGPPSIDQAAILVGALAAVIGTSGIPGPWLLFNSMVGLTVLVIVVAFAKPHRDQRILGLWRQPLALAIVIGLVACLALSWPAQLMVVGPLNPDAGDTKLGELTTKWAFPVIWVVTAPIAYALQLRWIRRTDAG